jgi:hypothetical protein
MRRFIPPLFISHSLCRALNLRWVAPTPATPVGASNGDGLTLEDLMEADSDSKPVTVGAADKSSGSLSMDAFSSERDMMRWIDDTLVAIFRRLDLSTL